MPASLGLPLQASAQVRTMDYTKKHILLGYLDERNDDIYQLTAGMTWQFMKCGAKWCFPVGLTRDTTC